MPVGQTGVMSYDAVNSKDRFNLKAVDTLKVAFAEVDAGTVIQKRADECETHRVHG